MSLWLVMPKAGDDNGWGGQRSVSAARQQARLVEAATAKDAAEGYSMSVLDLRNGTTLLVAEVPERAYAFHREYAYKGAGAWEGDMPSDPVTIARGIVSLQGGEAA